MGRSTRSSFVLECSLACVGLGVAGYAGVYTYNRCRAASGQPTLDLLSFLRPKHAAQALQNVDEVGIATDDPDESQRGDSKLKQGPTAVQQPEPALLPSMPKTDGSTHPELQRSSPVDSPAGVCQQQSEPVSPPQGHVTANTSVEHQAVSGAPPEAASCSPTVTPVLSANGTSAHDVEAAIERATASLRKVHSKAVERESVLSPKGSGSLPQSPSLVKHRSFNTAREPPPLCTATSTVGVASSLQLHYPETAAGHKVKECPGCALGMEH